MPEPPGPADPRGQQQESDDTVRRDARIAWALAGTLALAVFLIGALTPLDITIAVFYVVIVLLIASSRGRTATSRAPWGCSAIIKHMWSSKIQGRALARTARANIQRLLHDQGR